MEEQSVVVGIDVSKAQLDTALGTEGEVLAFSNDEQGISRLLERLKAIRPSLVVMEASGGYETAAATAIAAAGWAMAVVNPRQVRDFARATGRLA
jgi:transposase